MDKLLRIHPDDNVLVVLTPIAVGESVSVGGRDVRMESALDFGHKLADRDIPKGDKVIKFGIPIGSATGDIALGAHVHLHNLKSDYLPTYTLTDEYISK